uniref:Uncharacterized protein n=1 Tax=Romanomermis culicivorax TaxID=13658 RepID=A0A915L9L0_ROMCU
MLAYSKKLRKPDESVDVVLEWIFDEDQRYCTQSDKQNKRDEIRGHAISSLLTRVEQTEVFCFVVEQLFINRIRRRQSRYEINRCYGQRTDQQTRNHHQFMIGRSIGVIAQQKPRKNQDEWRSTHQNDQIGRAIAQLQE